MVAVIPVVLAAVLVACGGAGTAAPRSENQRPQPRIATPGPLALTRDGRSLVVADRDLRRLVRIDLRTRRRTVVASGLPQGAGRPHAPPHWDALRQLRRAHLSNRRHPEGRHCRDGRPKPHRGRRTGEVGRARRLRRDRRRLRQEPRRGRVRQLDPGGRCRGRNPNGRGERKHGLHRRWRACARRALGHPHDVIWRHDGVLLIADSHHRVVRQVAAPMVLEPGPRGTVYVADAGRRSVYRLSADGRGRRLVARANVPIGLAVDDRGNVYVSELEGRKRVLRVSPAGRVTVLAAGS